MSVLTWWRRCSRLRWNGPTALVDDSEITRSPMERRSAPTVPEQPVDILTDEQLVRLIAACKGSTFEDRRDLALIRLFIDTGARAGEVLGLSVDHVDLANQYDRLRRPHHRRAAGISRRGASTSKPAKLGGNPKNGGDRTGPATMCGSHGMPLRWLICCTPQIGSTGRMRPGETDTPCKISLRPSEDGYQRPWTTEPLCSVPTLTLLLQSMKAGRSCQPSIASRQCSGTPAGVS
jgi:hypothetical protein